jgi:putative PIN family toxin of toxin-antitoxin system
MKADLSAAYARVVVDTNVLVSAALMSAGAPALLDKLLAAGALVFSPATFAELESRLWKPKFDRYLSLERRQRLLHDLNASAFWVDIPRDISVQKFSRDVSDDAFVHAAMTAKAVRLVSGDDDLLCLHPIVDLHILSPRAALDELSAM